MGEPGHQSTLPLLAIDEASLVDCDGGVGDDGDGDGDGPVDGDTGGGVAVIEVVLRSELE